MPRYNQGAKLTAADVEPVADHDESDSPLAGWQRKSAVSQADQAAIARRLQRRRQRPGTKHIAGAVIALGAWSLIAVTLLATLVKGGFYTDFNTTTLIVAVVSLTVLGAITGAFAGRGPMRRVGVVFSTAAIGTAGFVAALVLAYLL